MTKNMLTVIKHENKMSHTGHDTNRRFITTYADVLALLFNLKNRHKQNKQKNWNFGKQINW